MPDNFHETGRCARGTEARKRQALSFLLTVATTVFLLATACASPPPRMSTLSSSDPEERQTVLTGHADVVVVDRPPDESEMLEKVSPLPPSLRLRANRQAPLEAMALSGEGRRLEDVRFQWSVLEDQAGRISTSGDEGSEHVFIASENAGEYDSAVRVTATHDTPMGQRVVSATVDITVVPDEPPRDLAEVDILFDEVAAVPGQVVRLRAVAYDSFGRQLEGAQFEWSLKDSGLGQFNDSFLTVDAPPGDYEDAITVTGLYEGSEVNDTVDLVVSEERRPETGVDLHVFPSTVHVRAGEDYRFNSVATDGSGAVVSTEEGQWEVTDPQVGTVNERGVFRAGEKAGRHERVVRFTTTYSGPDGDVTLEDYATVVVEKKQQDVSPLESVEVVTEEIVVNPGETASVRTRALDAEGSPAVGVSTEWEIADPEIAEITEGGLVRAHGAPGVYPDLIEGTVTQEAGGEVIRKTVTADLVIAGEIVSLRVMPQRAVVDRETVTRFRAEALDANGVEPPGVFYEWSVADAAAGSIDSLGVFRAGPDPGSFEEAVRVRAVQRSSE
ncbi:MAG: hypothetical protein ACOC5K_02725 [Chloroflexota bacterium]